MLNSIYFNFNYFETAFWLENIQDSGLLLRVRNENLIFLLSTKNIC